MIVNEFAGPEPTPFMLDALVAYMQEFDFLPNSRRPATGRLTDKAGEAAHRGEAIFKRRFAETGRPVLRRLPHPVGQFPGPQGPRHRVAARRLVTPTRQSTAFDTPTLLGAQVYRALLP